MPSVLVASAQVAAVAGTVIPIRARGTHRLPATDGPRGLRLRLARALAAGSAAPATGGHDLVSSGVGLLRHGAQPDEEPVRRPLGLRLWGSISDATPHALIHGDAVDYRVAARLGALLYGVGALATILVQAFRPLTDVQRQGVIIVCLAGIVIATVIWVLPWQRWRSLQDVVLLPVAFIFIRPDTPSP